MNLTRASVTAMDWQAATGAKSDIKQAAREFEAVLLSQILRGMGSTGLGTSEESGGQLIELGQEMVAHAMSETGGLGLAALVEQGLRRQGE